MPWLKCKVCSLFMRNNEGLNWKPDHVQISIIKFFRGWKWNGKMFNKNSKTFLQFTFLVSSQSCVLCKVVDRNSHIIIKSQKMGWCHLWNFQKLREFQLPDDGNPQLTLLKAHDSLLVSKTSCLHMIWEKYICYFFAIEKICISSFFRHLCVDVWIQEKTWFGSIFW